MGTNPSPWERKSTDDDDAAGRGELLDPARPFAGTNITSSGGTECQEGESVTVVERNLSVVRSWVVDGHDEQVRE